MADRRFGFCFSDAVTEYSPWLPYPNVDQDRFNLGLSQADPPGAAMVNAYQQSCNTQFISDTDKWVLREAVLVPRADLGLRPDLCGGPGVRWYVVNEPDIEYENTGRVKPTPADLADKTNELRLRLDALGGGRILVSPAFSEAGIVASANAKVIVARGPGPDYDYDLPYAETWIRWMQQKGYALPSEFSFHSYPRADRVRNATTVANAEEAVCDAIHVTENVRQLLIRTSYSPWPRLILSEIGAPSCLYAGAGYWDLAVNYATALANAVKAGRLRVDDICWFLQRSYSNLCPDVGVPSCAGYGGFLLYSNIDPDGPIIPYNPSGECTNHPCRAPWTGRCTVGDQQPKGTPNTRTLIGNVWYNAATT